MKITVIAEKPSVARDIANILGAKEKKDGYIQGNGYFVTWAFGHLVGLAMPEEYGFEGFRKENLPIIPDNFKLKVRQVRDGKKTNDDPGVAKQLKIINRLFNESDEIIVATDAGREGELIFRYIYKYLKCNKPFKRLWISSLTDKAISQGLDNLKSGKDYDNLYFAGNARSIADWLAGINGSQALSIAAGSGTFSLGRVQTPTLAMICSRFIENKEFKPQKFWQIRVNSSKDKISFHALSNDKYHSDQKASEITEKVKNAGSIFVSDVVRKEVSQAPPLLYDLTSLQKDANSKYGFTADSTLSIAQGLYEKKYITYPRTGSRYISEDIFEEIAEKISFLEKYDLFSEYAKDMAGTTLTRHSVNDKKVTDHHALLITENIPNDLSSNDKIIYNLIAGRMLESFSQKCIKDTTTIVLEAGGYFFSTKGSIIKSAGWRAVYANAKEEKEDENEENCTLPELTKGDILALEKVETLEKQTKAKPLHNESSLLTAMETCGKEIEDEELKGSLKDCGIGTPATRASVIETLLKRQYIVRNKKTLVPTEKGMVVYNIVKAKSIANVEMTGQWENTLAKIEKGEVNPDIFLNDIKEYTKELTKELLSIEGIKIASTGTRTHACPKCKKPFKILAKVGKCFNPDCNLTIFMTIAGKKITPNHVEALITKRKTSLIKGFYSSKKEKHFDAILKLNDQWEVEFEFEKRKGTNGKR